jgi:hypothetical protein
MQPKIFLKKAFPFWLRPVGIAALVFMLAASLTACSSPEKPVENQAHDLKMAALEEMPAEVKTAPDSVQQAYQFALANPEVLEQIPCYCGCGDMGHTSNYACYFSGKEGDPNQIFDNHALGCSICVDITQDTMRLMREGKSVQEVRTYVDSTYAKYGPSNIP